MEAVYLMCSVVSTFVTSAFLTLRLLFKSLFLPRFPSEQREESLYCYQGQVEHMRRRPRFHYFCYPVRYALVNLDLASDSRSTLFPPSFFRAHLSAEQARLLAGTTGDVFLLTIPPSLGYEQNPLSIYYCFNMDGSSTHLEKCIAEVTNTPWGERVSFVFNPDSDTVAKPLHVSPFMDMQGNWRMRVNTPGEDLVVEISIQHPELGDYFNAGLKAKRVESVKISNMEVFFWLMPQKVALWIYWQALRLWWKDVTFLNHPKYRNPAYREEVIRRDRKLQCPLTMKHDVSSQLCLENSGVGRLFAWRDARWPWS